KNDKNLSSSDKKDVKGFVNQINSYLVGKTKDLGLLDVKSSGILNIMMIMVKAFCDSMNTESLDMLSQIDQISLNNMFLAKAEDKLVANSDSLSKLADIADRGWIFIAASVVIMVIVVVTMFYGGGEGEDVTAGKGEGKGEGKEGLKQNAPPINGEGGASAKPPSTSSSSSTTSEELPKGPLEESKPPEIDTTGDPSNDTGIDDAKKTGDAAEAKPGKISRIVKNGMRSIKYPLGGAFLCFSLYTFLKGIAPSAVNFKNSVTQPVDPIKLAQVQNTGAIESTLTDMLNNSTQNASKFMDNDSQKQNQYSGYVQQAINMFGQAYTGQ
ncbi:MAG: hypothetical protein KR126chlam5_01202, partial [Candidatus Anoxychlamydiales bacterium]|nr:hypothetical protein [Candidatus Anoxychlamydiales bacterium]